MGEVLLRGEHITKCYGAGETAVYAMKDVSFTVSPGEFVVVLGPSGSGKSTLLNMMGGMDQPSEGKLWYQDQDLSAMNDSQLANYRRSVVGFVFQFFHLLPSLTAVENVSLAASMVSEPLDPFEVLERVGLKGREHHFPSQLSGGEQQRVSIARAIVKGPKLLLCDEPTGALDSKNGQEVVQLLLEVRDRLACPVITITHNEELARLADRVFTMRDGRLL